MAAFMYLCCLRVPLLLCLVAVLLFPILGLPLSSSLSHVDHPETQISLKKNHDLDQQPKNKSTTNSSLEKRNIFSKIQTKPTNKTKLAKPKNSTTQSVQENLKVADQHHKSGSQKNKTAGWINSSKGSERGDKIEQAYGWVDQEDEKDLVSEFRDLHIKFRQTLMPDLERISYTSRNYLAKASEDVTNGLKPYIGNKYAPLLATFVSFVFCLIPLLLVILMFSRLRFCFISFHKILNYIHVYLAIYFSILCASSLLTGIEPGRFFYATSQTTYAWFVVGQTVGYVLYVLILLMHLVLNFSTKCWLGSKLFGLGQAFLGFTIGLHYYVSVFHRVVLHQPPAASWKTHGIYATCFVVICLIGRAAERKKVFCAHGEEPAKEN